MSGGAMDHEVASRSASWAKFVCMVLLAATMLNYANRFVVTENSTRIQREFETDERGYGRVNAMFSWGFAIGGLTFGVLADWLSVRWLYPAVVLAWSLASFWSGRCETLAVLQISQFFVGLFEAGHWPCALRTTQRVFSPAQRGWGNSVLQSGASIGAVATPLLVAGLRTWDPEIWRWGFYIVAAAGVPWAIVWVLSVRDEDLRKPVLQARSSNDDRGQDQPMQEFAFWRLFLMRRWWLLLIVVNCINLPWHYVRVWLPNLLHDQHEYTEEFVNYFRASYYLATFFGSVAAGWMMSELAARRWAVHRARLATFLTFTVLSCAVVPAAFLPRGGLLLATLLVVGFGSLGLFPVYYSLNQELSAKNQGKVGGSLAFSTWALMSLVHEGVGRVLAHDPTLQPYLLAAVGLGPILAFAALFSFWEPRDSASRSAASL